MENKLIIRKKKQQRKYKKNLIVIKWSHSLKQVDIKYS